MHLLSRRPYRFFPLLLLAYLPAVAAGILTLAGLATTAPAYGQEPPHDAEIVAGGSDVGDSEVSGHDVSDDDVSDDDDDRDEGRDEDLDRAEDRQFFDQVSVSLQTVVTRVIDRRGKPVLNLKPEDLVAKVGGVEVPIYAVDWYTGTSNSPARDGDASSDDAEDGLQDWRQALTPQEVQQIIEATDRLVVIFVQVGHHQVVTLDETYVSGHLKLLPHLRKMLDELDPEDRVAVVSYDSRLKVWLDFTLDREAVNDAIYDGIGFGKPDPRRNHRLSLLDVLDERAMRKATTPELALLATARALDKLPGIKDMIFVGWGLGRYTHGVGVLMPEDFSTAINVLGRSQTTVSVLDVTQTESHALSSGLQSIAAATGGTYASTYDAVGRKVSALGRTLRGYYIVSLDRNALPDEGGKLELTIPRRDTSVLHSGVVFQKRRRTR